MSIEGNNTKKRLIKVARKLFSQYSYNYVSTRMIAEKANIGQSAIFFHFGSKEGLFAAVLEQISSANSNYFEPIRIRIEKDFEDNIMTKEKAYDYFMEYIDTIIGISFSPANKPDISISNNSGCFPDDLLKPLMENIHTNIASPMAKLLCFYKDSEDMMKASVIIHAILSGIFSFRFSTGYTEVKNLVSNENKAYLLYMSETLKNHYSDIIKKTEL